MLVFNAYIRAFFVRIYMRVCKKIVIYLGIKTPQSGKERKHTWHKNARIWCSRNDSKYTWEKMKQMADHSIHRHCQESLFQIVSHFTGPIDKKCIALSTIYWIIPRYPADNLLGKQPSLSSTLEVCPKDL